MYNSPAAGPAKYRMDTVRPLACSPPLAPRSVKDSGFHTVSHSLQRCSQRISLPFGEPQALHSDCTHLTHLWVQIPANTLQEGLQQKQLMPPSLPSRLSSCFLHPHRPRCGCCIGACAAVVLSPIPEHLAPSSPLGPAHRCRSTGTLQERRDSASSPSKETVCSVTCAASQALGHQHTFLL